MSGLTKLTLTGLASEVRDCPRHGQYESKNLFSSIWTECPACAEEQNKADLKKAQQQFEHVKQRTVDAILGRAGIPKRFRDRNLDGFVAHTSEQDRVLRVCKAYAERFSDRLANGGGLVMCGQPGTGKTHLACAIANYIAPQGRTSLFLTVMEAVRRVKQTWSKEGESEAQAIAKMLEPDLLIIDEVGVQFGSEAERLIIFEIINGRYCEMRPTILISNLAVEELGKYLGERVVDRMREGGGAILAFNWESKRSEIKSMYAPEQEPDWERLHNKLVGQK